MTLILIGPPEIRALQQLREFAELPENIYRPFLDTLEQSGPCSGCGQPDCSHLWESQRKCCPDCSHGRRLNPDATVPGHDPRHTLQIDDYRLVYSITQDRSIRLRHLSASIRNQERLPHPAAIEEIIRHLGYVGGLASCEAYAHPVEHCIIVVQPIAPDGNQILTVWTIYDHPRDFPDSFVVRKWQVFGDRMHPVPMPDGQASLHESLEAARESLPRGLTCIPRSDEDDLTIHETWI